MHVEWPIGIQEWNTCMVLHLDSFEMEYRKKRNVTSHAYDEKLAQEVYLVAIAFLTDAQSLLQVLKDRNQK